MSVAARASLACTLLAACVRHSASSEPASSEPASSEPAHASATASLESASEGSSGAPRPSPDTRPVVRPAAEAGSESKASQCDRFADVVNEHSEPISTAIKNLMQSPTKPELMTDFVRSAKAANDAITALSFTDEKVTEFVKAYIDVLAAVDRFANTMATTTKTKDPDALDKFIADYKAFEKLQDEMNTDINAYCPSK